MDNDYIIKLKILEDDIIYVTDVLMGDKRIDVNVRREYMEWLKEIVYSGIDDLVDEDECSLNFK